MWRSSGCADTCRNSPVTGSTTCETIASCRIPSTPATTNQTPATAATISRDRYTRLLDDPDEQFACRHDHETQCDSGANLVFTTQKDSVKLRAGSLGPTPLRAVRIGLEITAGNEIMDDLLALLLPGQFRNEPREKDFA